MTTSFQVNLLSPQGVFIDQLDEFDKLSAGLKVNDIGRFSIDVPYRYYRYMQEDVQFEIRRSVDGGPARLFGGTRWFGRKFVRRRVGDPFTVSGPNLNILLKRAIIAYPTGAAETDMTDQADDIIKRIATQNLVYDDSTLPTLPARGFSRFTVQPQYSEGPSLTKSFAWRECFPVLQELAQAAQQAGTYLTFDVQVAGDRFELQTFAGCRGVDRREGVAARPLILSEEAGTLQNVTRTDDYENEVTAVYAGGQGREADRLIGFAYDTARIEASPFNYIEKFIGVSNTNDQAALDAEAAAELAANRPKHTIEGDVVDGPDLRYGQQYGLGDFATALYDTDKMPVEINNVTLTYSGEEETITTKLAGSLW